MEPNRLDDNELFEENVSLEKPEQNGSNNRPFIIGVGILGAIVVFSILAIIAYVILFRPKTTSDLQSQAAEINAQNTAISFIASQTAEFEQKQSTQKAAPSTTSVKPSQTSVVAMPTATPGAGSQATSVAGSQATSVTGSQATSVTGSQATSVTGSQATSVTGSQATSVAGQDPAIRTATVAAFQTQAAANLLGTPVAGGTLSPQQTSVAGGTLSPQQTPTTLPTAGFMDEVGLPALFGTAIALIIIIFLVRKLRFSDN